MIRRWQNFAILASAVLCVVLVDFWRLSYGYGSFERWVISANDFYVLRVSYGIIELDHTVCSSRNLPADMSQKYWVWMMPQAFHAEWNPKCKSVLGLGIRNEPLIFPMGNAVVIATTHGRSIPFWMLTAIAAALPLRRAVRWYRVQQMGPNACGICGYDLSGNTSGARPECGTPVPTKLETVA